MASMSNFSYIKKRTKRNAVITYTSTAECKLTWSRYICN